MKAPVFAYGSYESLVKAIADGKIKYPTYCWLKDTLQYAFVNKQGEIELVGIPKLTGSLEHEIHMNELHDGVYEIRGQHKIAESAETTYLAASYIVGIVASEGDTKKIRRITADDIDDWEVTNGVATKARTYVTDQYLEEKGYMTETAVDSKIAVMQETLEEEMKDYVDSIIAEQVAELVPEYVDIYIDTVPPEDVQDLFANP